MDNKQIAIELLNEVEDIERWSGDAYQGWSSELGLDEVALAVENLKLLAIYIVKGDMSEGCPECGAETEGHKVYFRCKYNNHNEEEPCSETSILLCSMCDGQNNGCDPDDDKLPYDTSCPNDCGIGGVCRFRIDMSVCREIINKAEGEIT